MSITQPYEGSLPIIAQKETIAIVGQESIVKAKNLENQIRIRSRENGTVYFNDISELWETRCLLALHLYPEPYGDDLMQGIQEEVDKHNVYALTLNRKLITVLSKEEMTVLNKAIPF